MKPIYLLFLKNIFAPLFVFIYINTRAQTAYLLNLNDPTTYSITCGTVNSSIWSVINSNCTLSTSNILTASSPAVQTFNASVTIEGSNMDYSDTATIQYSVNGIWTIAKIIHGQVGLYTYANTFTITANANSTIVISVNGFNDKSNERWRVYSGKITLGDPVPLPVELLSFSGEKTFNAMNLFWATATETENNFFTVERSIDGDNFSNVGKVMASGNSSTAKKYSFTDYEVKNGTNYYRLKQTDFNGSEKYCSGIIAVEYHTAPSSFDVYPNPLIGQDIYLNIDNNGQKEILITIADVKGKTLFSKVLPSNTSGETIVLPELHKELSSGVYLVTGTCGKESYHQKIIIR